MPRMILVSGCSAVGKTTLAKRLASRLELRYLSADNFYEVINGDERLHENKFDVWMALYRALHIAEQQGIDCIVDANTLTTVDRDQFLGWFPGFEHHLIYIHADPELRKRNNMMRSRQVPDAAMDRMTRIVQEPSSESLDSRWKSYVRVNNVNNDFLIAELEGDAFYA